jgi:hypothetical protein
MSNRSKWIHAMPNRAGRETVRTDMQDLEMIDFELWVISMIRAECRRDSVRLPDIARADELLDERLALAHPPSPSRPDRIEETRRHA